MPTIRIDEEVYKSLQLQAEAFVDSPNSVLRRILGLPEGRGPLGDSEPLEPVRRNALRKGRARASDKRKRHSKSKRPTRATSESILPSDRYEEPILRALVEHGGTASAREVIDDVGRKLRSELTDVDKGRMSSGGVRWENRVQFARLHLVEQGLIATGTSRGVWSLTEAGRRKVQ